MLTPFADDPAFSSHGVPSEKAFPESGASKAMAARAADLPPLAPLPVLDAAPLDPATLKGRVVLVHFFATWCEPCREELPALTRLAADHPADIAVVAVDVAEVDVRVRRFFAEHPVPFPVALDRDRAFTRSWQVSGLPSTIVLDRALRPRLKAVGEVAWDAPAVRVRLGGLLSEPFPERPAASVAGKKTISGDLSQ
ncbi:hypothetical protein GCM10007301_47480 [Azorhizobium oxalatiphilum]|uniref:Thioredoxin domain-containing protein n=2 Tax=Azorhizobium oxalatiphilum TaxID=980631 RepID=A0A917CAH5_9HYPH|nr:hypothetical protein GCM10007301_47480 [Azorhizobium oxalatiphilum]